MEENMKVWLTTQIESSTRKMLRIRANQLGMKMGPLIDKLINDGLAYQADKETMKGTK